MSWPDASATPQEVIDRFGLEPLAIEGGWWGTIERTAAGNGIWFLMTPDGAGFSALHRLSVTETWTWLAGAPASMLLLSDASRDVTLDAARPGVVVEPGTWQGASTLGEWTLVACWCVPAFTDDCFELGARADLAARHRELAGRITELTRS
ncbi:cupin domain-containing protein [Propioniciclava tarda]|nr:cupin domain-containing protein [Propioniciclava tarda]SMO46286.1 hypothetical protein SAMN06266982_10382 [Propioniciclava tarda]HOA87995.1 cupin domain-containing protein [Propioniciclava tarda]HQA29929.1 cupin domain-containing protein [Propioniciclava tarda]